MGWEGSLREKAGELREGTSARVQGGSTNRLKQKKRSAFNVGFDHVRIEHAPHDFF